MKAHGVLSVSGVLDFSFAQFIPKLQVNRRNTSDTPVLFIPPVNSNRDYQCRNYIPPEWTSLWHVVHHKKRRAETSSPYTVTLL